MRKLGILILALSLILTMGSFSQVNAEEMELTFYYPVQVAGPLANAIDSMTEEFNAENPDIDVTPVYSGDYDQTMQRTQTAALAGDPPDVGILLAIDLLTLRHSDLIIPLDEFVEDNQEYIDDFYEAFLENSTLDGHLWGIPFQRSTPLVYYNKEIFEEEGFDSPPTNWDELLKYSQELTTEDRHGLTIVTDDTWILQSFILQNDGIYNNVEGTETYFDSPEVIEALEFWVELANEYEVMPRHRFYGEAGSDFVAEQTAMMYNSTGSLSFVRDSADFEFGTAILPENKRNAVATGGGNFYIFDGIGEERQEAAWEFIEWMTQPERIAEWTIISGYIPARQSAVETDTLQEYYEEFPQAETALEQLEYGEREMSLHNNTQIREFFLTAIQEALEGTMTAEEALERAQRQSERVLAPYQE